MVVLLLLNFVESLLEVIQNVVDMLGADAQTMVEGVMCCCASSSGVICEWVVV